MLVAYSIDYVKQLNRWFIMKGFPKEQYEEAVDSRHPKGFATQKEAEDALSAILGVRIENVGDCSGGTNFNLADTLL